MIHKQSQASAFLPSSNVHVQVMIGKACAGSRRNQINHRYKDDKIALSQESNIKIVKVCCAFQICFSRQRGLN